MTEIAEFRSNRCQFLASCIAAPIGSKAVGARCDRGLFRTELVNLMDHRHELVRLVELPDWQALADESSRHFVPITKRPALPALSMAALLRVYEPSDEHPVGRLREKARLFAKEGLVVGVFAMPGNPHDGYIADSEIEQIEVRSQRSDTHDRARGLRLPRR